jgi:hypothetical protein
VVVTGHSARVHGMDREKVAQRDVSSGTCMLCPDGRDGGSVENTAVVAQK